MTEETARALIDAIDRLTRALSGPNGLGQQVHHYHYQQPQYGYPSAYPQWPSHSPNYSNGGGAS